MIGHIPKKITYYIRSGDKNLPAFACDSDSKSMKVAGEKWVHNYGVWNTNTKKYDYNQQITISIEFYCDNVYTHTVFVYSAYII